MKLRSIYNVNVKEMIWENDSTEKLIKIILLRVIFLKFNRNKWGEF